MCGFQINLPQPDYATLLYNIIGKQVPQTHNYRQQGHSAPQHDLGNIEASVIEQQPDKQL
jgi:hypothetical protein